MPDTIELQIVTPEGVQLETNVTELTAPSVKGEFGVLPGHRPLLAALRTGIVTYTEKGSGQPVPVAVGPGFAKVVDDKAVILTDKFITKPDVDPIVARKDLKAADEVFDKMTAEGASDDERAKVLADVRWAAVRLELYGDPPPATIMVEHEMKLLGHEDYSATLASSDKDDAHVEHEGVIEEKG